MFAANRLDARQATHHLELEVVADKIGECGGVKLVDCVQESDSGSFLLLRVP